MNNQSSRRPTAEEYAPYFGRYIDLVSDGDIGDLLAQQIGEFGEVLGAIHEEKASVLHAPYTWTIKQAVGHMIDVEKVFGYRAHRFACHDLRPILGMEQNDFVDNLEYKVPLLSDLAVELKCARRSNCLFLNRIPDAAWDQTGEADGSTLSVRAIAYTLVGHITHHLEIIKRRVV